MFGNACQVKIVEGCTDVLDCQDRKMNPLDAWREKNSSRPLYESYSGLVET